MAAVIAGAARIRGLAGRRRRLLGQRDRREDAGRQNDGQREESEDVLHSSLSVGAERRPRSRRFSASLDSSIAWHG